MDCTGCTKNCCKNNHLVISVKDLDFFLSKIPDLLYVQYGPFILLAESCPFFDPNKQICDIYENRPAICRLFPFDFKGQLNRCKAGDTVTPQDRVEAFKIIHNELPRMWDEAHKYPKELDLFNKKIKEIRIWQ